MNRISLLEKLCKHENGHNAMSVRDPQPSAHTNFINNGTEKMQYFKLGSITPQHLKRRRSRSHSIVEHCNADDNKVIFSLYSNKISHDRSQLLNNSAQVNKRCIIERHKKETHNRVERKRRDFINAQIKKLSELLPSDFISNYDLKMNKGVILKNSVEYISSMKDIEEINQQLVRETDLSSRLIENLVAFKNLTCSKLSLAKNADEDLCKDDVDINDLIMEWHAIHQDNKELIDKFTQGLSQKLSDDKKDPSYENMSIVDSINNNSIHILHPSRKRYSSVPNYNGADRNGFTNMPTCNLVENKPSLLNELLRKSDVFNHNNIAESTIPTFNLDNDDDAINCYLQCPSSSITDDDISNTDTVIVDQVHRSLLSTNETLIHINNNMFYVVPTSSNADHYNDDIVTGSSLDQSNYNLITNTADPMLFSDNVGFDNGDS